MKKTLRRTLMLSPIFAALLHPLACAPVDEPSDASSEPPPVVVARPYPGEPGALSAVADHPDLGDLSGGQFPGVGADDVDTGAPTSSHGISYHGGPVMSGTVNVYYIWYGNWSGNSATSILTDFANNIGGSPYENVNELYNDNFGGRVTGAARLAGSTTDSYSQGTNLSFNGVWTVVSNAISQGRLPNDANGVYFVLASSDVAQDNGGGSTFCGAYCGWHTYSGYGGNNIKFSFVGNGDRCPSACRQGSGPNGNAGADGMASVIAHELEEAASDPLINAWYDSSGWENADKCAWTFGSTYSAPNGALANMRLGNRDYLIQRNWLNSGAGSCGLSQTVGSFNFDEGSGTLARNTGAGVNGSLVGGAGWTSGIAGTAVSLNGTNGWVDTGAHLLDTSQSFTISTWVKLNSIAGWQTMVAQDGNTVSPFYLQIRGDNSHFTLQMHTYESLAMGTTADSTFVPKTGVWYNVVGVYDQPNGQIKLYVNGVLQSTTPYTGGWNATGHTTIGRSKFNGGQTDWINGAIDETSVYSRVLSPAEVTQFYQNRAGLLLQRTGCATVHSQLPTAGDGDAVINVGGNLVTVYCAGMASSPREYLPLLRTGGSYNKSYYGVSGNSPGLTTNYTKVRFYPSDLTVDTTDTTFSSSSGSKSFGASTFYTNNFANAGDCAGSYSATGTANVDLTGTAFAVAASQFTAQGWHPGGTATYSAGSQVVDLTGGGYCGSMETTPSGTRLKLQ